jgi:Domain of unknown function (DUF4167)
MNDDRNRSRAQPHWRRGGPRPKQRNGGSDTATAARRSYERYISLAREAASRGDPIETENCYQHAEHFLRLMKQAAA